LTGNDCREGPDVADNPSRLRTVSWAAIVGLACPQVAKGGGPHKKTGEIRGLEKATRGERGRGTKDVGPASATGTGGEVAGLALLLVAKKKLGGEGDR